jgi:hypothetical protein
MRENRQFILIIKYNRPKIWTTRHFIVVQLQFFILPVKVFIDNVKI